MIGLYTFDAPARNIAEVRRYARIMGENSEVDSLLDECMAKAEPVLSYKVCYTTQAIVRTGDRIRLGNLATPSAALRKALNGCERAVLFAATVGTPYDRLIAKYSRLSPAKALLLQAIGAERVESLCDAFVERYQTENHCALKTRVSPGYGDIELGLQRELFAMLDCPRKIGLSLNESLLMSPSKSVTAIAGVTCGDVMRDCNKCRGCDRADCEFRNQRDL